MVPSPEAPVGVPSPEPPATIHGLVPPVTIHGLVPPETIHSPESLVTNHGPEPSETIYGPESPATIYGPESPAMIHGSIPPAIRGNLCILFLSWPDMVPNQRQLSIVVSDWGSYLGSLFHLFCVGSCFCVAACEQPRTSRFIFFCFVFHIY
jgi:hypothetical protein